MIDNPSFLTVGRISRSNLSLGGGYYCDVYIKRRSQLKCKSHTTLTTTGSLAEAT